MHSVQRQRKLFWSTHRGPIRNILFINNRCSKDPRIGSLSSRELHHSPHQRLRSGWSTSMLPTGQPLQLRKTRPRTTRRTVRNKNYSRTVITRLGITTMMRINIQVSGHQVPRRWMYENLSSIGTMPLIADRRKNFGLIPHPVIIWPSPRHLADLDFSILRLQNESRHRLCIQNLYTSPEGSLAGPARIR